MNNSQKTVALAKGIHLWAVRQDLPLCGPAADAAQAAFDDWAARYPALVALAQAEQYRLFDVLLAQRAA